MKKGIKDSIETPILKALKDRTTDNIDPPDHGDDNTLVVPPNDDAGDFLPLPPPLSPRDTISLMIRTDPANPQNERFLGAWRLELFNIDDLAQPTGPSHFARSGPDGNLLAGLPSEMLMLPLVIVGHNNLLAQAFEETKSRTPNTDCENSTFEIFVPPLLQRQGRLAFRPIGRRCVEVL